MPEAMAMVRDLIGSARPVNQIMTSAAVWVGWMISQERVVIVFDLDVIFLMVSAALFAGGSNYLNDILDRNIDLKAHPERPITSGRLKLSGAVTIMGCMLVSSLILALVVSLINDNPIPLLILTIALIMEFTYEKILKGRGLGGNMAVSVMVALTFPFGAAVVSLTEIIFLISAMAVLANTSREIVKDVQDMESELGIRFTLPMRIGKRRSLLISSLFMTAAVTVSLYPVIFMDVNPFFQAAITLTDIFFIYSIFRSFRNPGEAQMLIKAGMIIAIFSFLLIFL
jgi:4-hydroxybenzoate polyprenyltransferase